MAWTLPLAYRVLSMMPSLWPRQAHSSRRLRQRGAELEGFVGERPPQPPAGAWGTGLLARLLFSWTGRGARRPQDAEFSEASPH